MHTFGAPEMGVSASFSSSFAFRLLLSSVACLAEVFLWFVLAFVRPSPPLRACLARSGGARGAHLSHCCVLYASASCSGLFWGG